MKARFSLAVASILFFALPAFAVEQISSDSGAAASDQAVGQVDHTTSKSTEDTTKMEQKSSAPLAEKIASFVSGFVVGTPIACIRLGGANDLEVAKTMPIIGKADNKVIVWSSRLAIYPGCAFVGLFEGPFYAWYKSRTMAGSKPFSRDAFSLGEIEKYEIRCHQ